MKKQISKLVVGGVVALAVSFGSGNAVLGFVAAVVAVGYMSGE